MERRAALLSELDLLRARAGPPRGPDATLKTPWAAVLVLGFASGRLGEARAESGRTSDVTSPRTSVEIVITGSTEALAAATDTLRELFARLHIVPLVQAGNIEAPVSEPRPTGSVPVVRAAI